MRFRRTTTVAAVTLLTALLIPFFWSGTAAPLAVVAAQDEARYPDSAAESFNALGTPGNALYLPLAPKNRGGWTATVAVQNAGETVSRASLLFLDEGGAEIATYEVPSLAPAGSTSLSLAAIAALPDGFSGAAVLRADPDARLAASVNLDKPGMNRASYEGFASGSATVYVPLLFKNFSGWNTFYQVQNLGSAPTPVTVTYRHRDSGQTWTESFTLPPFSPLLLQQRDDGQLPDGFVGSAVVTATDGQALALVAHEEKDGLATEYAAGGDGASTLSAPLLFKNYNGYNSGWQIQNAGSAPATVVVTYRRSNGDGTWTASATIEPGASASFEQARDPQLPDGAVLSGVATSTNGQPLIGIVNETKYDENMVLTYVSAGSGSSEIYAPLMLKEEGSWRTGIQVQNLDGSEAPVTVEFRNPDGTLQHAISEGIPAGQSRTYDLQNIEQIPNGWVGAARARSITGRPITGVVNQVKRRSSRTAPTPTATPRAPTPTPVPTMAPTPTPAPLVSGRMKGLNYRSWWAGAFSSSRSDKSLAYLKDTGADWVSIVIIQYQDSIDSTTIHATADTPSDADIAHAIQRAHALGLRVMLKPHVDIPNGERARIGNAFATDRQWDAWFGSYKAFLLHYAGIAKANGVEMFNVGTELRGTMNQSSRWRATITAVRGVYSRELTYSAGPSAVGWVGEDVAIDWWDALDYIGLSAYYPLTGWTDPTLDQLKSAWQPWTTLLSGLSAKWKKPVLFTEIGYRNVEGTNREPWDWQLQGSPDLQEQADCYEAVFESVWNQPWFAGAFWWEWGTNPDQGEPTDTGYTPHGRPAEDVLKKWYAAS